VKSPERYWSHTKKLLLLYGAPVATAVLLALAVIAWAGEDLTTAPEGRLTWVVLNNSPIGRGVLAAISIVPIMLAFIAVPLIASRFLRNLYGLASLENAHTFLNRIVFGTTGMQPRLLIREGKVHQGADSILHQIGGPGSVVIYNDSAIVTERHGRLERVLGAHYPRDGNIPRLKPFEKVWDVIDLRPQRAVREVTAMTREGIPVTCEVDVSFKIDDRARDARGQNQTKPATDTEPYPYTPEAVFLAATSRRIRDPMQGEQDWAAQVIGTAEGTLRNILAEYRLDWLVAPARTDGDHPRRVIRQRLEEQLDGSVAGVGARIMRVDLGEIQVKDENIPHQWVEAWQADWESRALAQRTEGEAELLRMDASRVQAQAETIITLTQALQTAVSSEEEMQPYLLATRLVEALRWMSYDPFTRAFMPPEAIRTLKRLQDSLTEEGLLPPGEQRQMEERE